MDTGENTLTGGRLRRVAEHVKAERAFCFTYGDGVADLDVSALIDFHLRHGRIATVTAVQPPGRYGALDMEGDGVRGFFEKPKGDGGWINGGFFVVSPKAIGYIDGDQSSWESESLSRLARDGELHAFQHRGFWKPMDTLRDKNQLEELWWSGRAPWKIWL